MQNRNTSIIRKLVMALLAAVALSNPSLAADIVLTPPAGGGVAVTNAAGNVTRLRVGEDGNVGIGTLNPTSKLEIAAQDGMAITGYQPFLTLRDSNAGNKRGRVQSVNGDLILLTDSRPAMVIQNLSGRVGINTTPTKATLEIGGSAGYYQFIGCHGIYAWDQLFYECGPTAHNWGIATADSILAAGYIAVSDERIKRIDGRSDAARDLATLAGIEVTDYSYIDTLTKGTGKNKKLIGQQVEKVYPQAVSRITDVVPDIYQKAQVKDGWVKLATNLKKGERVRLIGKKTEGIHEVLEVAPGRFRTGFAADGDAVFVYGREVKDFRTVDYEAIAMLNVSATQELKRRLERQAADFAAQAQEMSKQTTRIAELEQDRQAQATRIAELEKQALEIAMLKQQMAELQAAGLTAGRLEAARLTAVR